MLEGVVKMLENLATEERNEKTIDLDTLSPKEILAVMNEEDLTVPIAIKKVLPQIELIVSGVISCFQKGGRLIYLGAGTSGRLGVLDAAECVPTFGVSKEQVIGLIAGGEKAFVAAIEGAEDSKILGENDLKQIKLTANDFVIGIAASGRTPYVIGALDYAKSVGAKTGAEILTGSTRLKAGTAQKLVLNMISTASMVGIGKVYKNLMVDVLPTNKKLEERSKRIIMEATEADYETANKFYEAAEKHVKVAIVMILTNSTKEIALEKLSEAKGFVRNTIQK